MHHLPEHKSVSRSQSRRTAQVYYFGSALLGAVVWGVLGITCGDFLVDCMFKDMWGDSTGSELPASIALMILTMPVGALASALFETPNWAVLIGIYVLNGALWGLALGYVYKKVRSVK